MRVKYLSALTLACLAAACGGDNRDTSGPNYALQVTASPDAVTLVQDQLSDSLTATVQNLTLNKEVTGATSAVVYSSADPAVATVFTDKVAVPGGQPGDSARRVRIKGTGGGSTVVYANYSLAKRDSILVTVTSHPATVLAVTPATATIWVDSTVKLKSTLLGAAGDTIKGRTVTYAVAKPDSLIGKVSSSGTVSGLSVGTARIIATYHNTSKATTVTAADTATLVDTSVVTFQARPVATVTVTPDPYAMVVGDTVTLHVTLKAANGATLTGRSIAFTSSDTTVAAVSTAGRVTAKGAGNATITATSEGQSGTSRIFVTTP